MKIIVLLMAVLLFADASENFYYQNNKKIELTPITLTQKYQRTFSKQAMIHYYKTPNNITLGISKEIIIKLKEKETIENILKKYPIILKRKLTSTLYVVKTNSTKTTLELSNLLYKDANIYYAHPNFIKDINQR